MYKQITAGNIQDLKKKIQGKHDCNIFIKPLVDRQMELMSVEDYNILISELEIRNITIILEEKYGKLRKLILNKIPM